MLPFLGDLMDSKAVLEPNGLSISLALRLSLIRFLALEAKAPGAKDLVVAAGSVLILFQPFISNNYLFTLL
jgi:hypothetical protein